MRLLFAHDHRFHRGPAGEMYTTGCLPASTWARYLDHFDEVHVIARDDGAAADASRLGRADYPSVSFEFLPSLSSVRGLLLRPREMDEQMRAAVEAADAVVARLPSEIGLLAARHAHALGKPYAIEVVGCAWDGVFNYGTLSGRLYAPIAYWRARQAIANAPMSLYVTSRWLQQRYPTKGYGACVSDVVLVPMTVAEEAKRKKRLAALAKGEKPILGTIASLRMRSKGIQTAIEALSSLRKSGLDFHYHLLGAGPVEPWAEFAQQLGVADLVHFDGTRSAGRGVGEWLDGIDVYLQPSFQEGLPRSTIEAMSRGAACIGSTCGGLPELIPADRLHRPGDSAGLADRIRALATDARAIAAASKRDLGVAKDFDPDLLKSRQSDFFARLRSWAGEKRSTA